MMEHNPVTVRLDEMVQVWKKQVQPHHALIRWMLKPEDSRMYEGFCRLEASLHGKLDNLFLFFYTSFENIETYSHAIMHHWLREYEDPEQQKAMQAAGITRRWEVEPFAQAVANNDYALCDELLPLMTGSYRQWINMPAQPLVLALLPKQMSHPRAFQQWIGRWMEQLRPPHTPLLLFDHADANHWGKVFDTHAHEAVSLHHDLRMQQAIRQIATSGATHDPHAFFRKCMFEMGDAAAAKNKALLNTWAAKGIECAKKSGDKILLATAYITAAGMLFNFKDHTAIDAHLDTGIRLCRQEITAGNDSMKPLLLQYYTYKGANSQVQKERKDALQWFTKAGDEARMYGFAAQAVSAYYKAYVFADYKNMHEQASQAATAAMQLTPKLTIEEIQSSEYPFMAAAFMQQQKLQHTALRESVAATMVNAFGGDWMVAVAELKKNYTKKKLRQAEAAA